MVFEDLGGFIHFLEKEGELIRINNPVAPTFEVGTRGKFEKEEFWQKLS